MVEATEFYRKMRCNGVVTDDDSKSFSVVMNCYSKLGFLGYGFGAVGLVLNRIGVNSLLNGLCEKGRIEEAALLFMKVMAEWGCAPDEVSGIAFDLHRKIADGISCFGSDVTCGMICYSTVIDGLCKDGRLERARELFDEMKRKGLEPDVVTYSSMIDGLCRGGEWDEAKAVFYEILDRGI